MLNFNIDRSPHWREGMVEEACQLGPAGRSFGILTLPEGGETLLQRKPVVVLLNAGLLHRVGPSRLYVTLARELSTLGFAVLRVDLVGRGDSAIPITAAHAATAEENFADIRSFIQSRFGNAPLILAGLCSGADNAVRFAIDHDDVIGLILLDPICFENAGFTLRRIKHRMRELLFHPIFSARRTVAALTRGLRGIINASEDSIDPLTIRNAPTLPEVQAAFSAVSGRRGHTLSIFTRYAMTYYNCSGQMNDVAMPRSTSTNSSEIFWPDVSHTYSLETHRHRLIDAVKMWCVDKFESVR
jgi:pimeloyl-ACP methyl ester carboxylesterase